MLTATVLASRVEARKKMETSEKATLLMLCLDIKSKVLMYNYLDCSLDGQWEHLCSEVQLASSIDRRHHKVSQTGYAKQS